jgi:hypothetical protein
VIQVGAEERTIEKLNPHHIQLALYCLKIIGMLAYDGTS